MRGAVMRWGVGFAALGLLCACGTEEDDASPTPEAVSFATVRDDILIPSCGFSSCHGSGAGGLTLTSSGAYDALVNVASAQQASVLLVKPGDASQSYLMMKLEDAAGITGDEMPPNGSLTAGELSAIRSWIDQGAVAE